MKALSIIQPWATAIAIGLKHYETRSWSTSYRGPILICSSIKTNDSLRLCFRCLCVELDPLIGTDNAIFQAFMEPQPLGAAIALADLVACRSMNEPFRWADDTSRQIEMLLGDWSPGRFAWQIENIVAIKPIPIKGKQGLFDPSTNVIDQVADQLRGVKAS